MILYNIKELEKLLINGKLSDKLAFKYLFIHLILFTLAGYIPIDSDNPAWSIWVHLLISLVAIIWGVRKTFEINQEGDNRDYFKRFISLSFVAGIRTFVIGLIISFLLVIGNKVAEHMISSSGQYLWIEVSELVGYTLLNIVFFYILIKSFKRVNSLDEKESSMEAVKV